MAQIHQLIASDFHMYQCMNNAIAGGVINNQSSGGSSQATRVTGAFGVSASANGLCTVTWAGDYSGTPMVIPNVSASASNDTGVANVAVFAVGGSSAALVGMNTAGGTANFVANVYIYGQGTGTRVT